jgi:hypothetical protein
MATDELGNGQRAHPCELGFVRKDVLIAAQGRLSLARLAH